MLHAEDTAFLSDIAAYSSHDVTHHTACRQRKGSIHAMGSLIVLIQL